MGTGRLRVAIVGGGIGGMAAGIALSRRGIDVTVFEQAAQLGEVGAGVQLTPNSIRLMERWGLGDALTSVGVPLGTNSRYYRRDGSLIAPVLTSSSDPEERVYGMHRADLLSLLADALDDGVVRVGHRCVGFEQDEHTARLAFDNGASAEADVVIAADGIHSVLHDFAAEPTHPVHSGSVAYRGLIPATRLPSWPTNTFELWMGEGKHLLVFPVRRGELINYVGFVPSHEEAKESWSAPGDPAELANAFAGWDPRIEELLAHVDSTFWWGLYDREPLQAWTTGRLTLLGDAAHPMLPHLGQGANQSVEDGAALAIMLAEADSATAPRALLDYESLRRTRTTQVQEGSRANGNRYDSAYEDLEQRDAEITASREFRLWLYDYDVEAEARAAMSRA